MTLRRTLVRTAALAALVLPGLPGSAAAQTERSVVVELYTSQGCSSCPPADDFFASLVDDPGVIPLALHVDYWDYLGWRDSFARPQHTGRQKAYAKANGAKMLYTPQIVVNGTDFVVGNKPADVVAAIARHLGADNGFRITLRREGDRILIEAVAEPPQDRVLRVQLVRFRPQEEVEIQHGENAGHTIDYHNIVTAWDQVAEWDAVGPFTAEAPLPGSDPAVVILQDGMGPILAAATLR